MVAGARRHGGATSSTCCCLSGIWSPLGGAGSSSPRLPRGAWQAASTPALAWSTRREVQALLATGEPSHDGHIQAHVALCERALAAYAGFKYCVAVNSHGSALFLLLQAVGVGHGDKVLGSCLSSRSIPSAVHHAEAKFVEVSCTPDLTLDVRDLAWKADKSGARFLVISHDSGHSIADLDELTRVASERGITVVEDCAQALGAWWDGRHTGHHGLACCFSAGPDTLLNAGEGGFVATDDVVIAASVAAMAGAYDSSTFRRRFAAPESHVFRDIDRGRFPNYSLAMPNIVAATLSPEISALERLVAGANRRYDLVADRLLAQAGEGLRSSAQLRLPRPHVKARGCSPSLLFSAALGPRASAHLLAATQARGVPLKVVSKGEDEGGQSPGGGLARASCYRLVIPGGLSQRQCQRAADVLVLALSQALELPQRDAADETPKGSLWHVSTRPSERGAAFPYAASASSSLASAGPEGPFFRGLEASYSTTGGASTALSAVPTARSVAGGVTKSLPLQNHMRPPSRPASESGHIARLSSRGPSAAGSLSFPVTNTSASSVPVAHPKSLHPSRIISGQGQAPTVRGTQPPPAEHFVPSREPSATASRAVAEPGGPAGGQPVPSRSYSGPAAGYSGPTTTLPPGSLVGLERLPEHPLASNGAGGSTFEREGLDPLRRSADTSDWQSSLPDDDAEERGGSSWLQESSSLSAALPLPTKAANRSFGALSTESPVVSRPLGSGEGKWSPIAHSDAATRAAFAAKFAEARSAHRQRPSETAEMPPSSSEASSDDEAEEEEFPRQASASWWSWMQSPQR